MKKDLLILPAQEVETSIGDMLVYGINKEIPKKTEVGRAIDITHDNNGLAILAHPHRFLLSYKMKRILNKNKFDGVEAYMWLLPKYYNLRINPMLKDYPTLFKLGSEDAHFWWELGWIQNELRLDDLTTESVLRALKRNEVKIRIKKMPTAYYMKYWLQYYHFHPFRKNAGTSALLNVIMKKERIL